MDTIVLWGRSDYTCNLVNISIPAPNIFVTSVKGEHLVNRSNKDVTAVQISEGNFNYLPLGLELFFNFTLYGITETNIKQVQKNDFERIEDLTVIEINRNPLKSVPENLFKNQFKVIILSMRECQLKELPTLLFQDLTELKILWIGSNEIEDLNVNLFANNLKLEEVLINNNKIKIIGGDLFKSLIHLKRLDLNNNVCINEDLNANGNKLEFFEKIHHLCQPNTINNKPTILDENASRQYCNNNSLTTFYLKELKNLVIGNRNVFDDWKMFKRVWKCIKKKE